MPGLAQPRLCAKFNCGHQCSQFQSSVMFRETRSEDNEVNCSLRGENPQSAPKRACHWTLHPIPVSHLVMKITLCWCTLPLVLSTLPLHAQLSPGNPLSGLEKLKDFDAMRASSSDPNWRNGNADARPIAPGGTLVI